MSTIKDTAYLQMAYGLAEKAKGWSSPNPYVGAVIVKRDIIVGTGFHERPGKPHAEVIALEKAGSRARDATAYITLEPCVHWGRTPPCVESILRSGLKRVVVSATDPNPLVNTQGIQRMKQAKMKVSVGLLQERNYRLNEIYNKYIQKKIPFLSAKVAASLDGKIATKTYQSRWLSSPQTREYVHLLRGEHEAIMVGINTILRDNPRLTVRHPHWNGKKITRVIVDSRLRLPSQAKLFQTLTKGKILVFTNAPSSSKKAETLRKKGADIISLKGHTQRVNLREVFSHLGKREISSVMVEGGRYLMTSLLETKLIDKLILILSPRLIGGRKAPSFFEGEGSGSIARSLGVKDTHAFTIGGDMILEGYL